MKNLDIKASELRNGVEVDTFKGEIGVDRCRLTVLYNKKTDRYELVKVVFATVRKPIQPPETQYSYRLLSDLVRTANTVTGQKDVGINDAGHGRHEPADQDEDSHKDELDEDADKWKKKKPPAKHSHF